MASPDMFVRYEARSSAQPAREEVAPGVPKAEGADGETGEIDDRWDASGPGLAKWGGYVLPIAGGDPDHAQGWLMRLRGYPPKLADHTPGLVWEVEGTRAVFVALDGGRYAVDLSEGDGGAPLAAGAGPVASWPAPVQHALLGDAEVRRLLELGALPATAVDEFLAATASWRARARTLSSLVHSPLFRSSPAVARMSAKARKDAEAFGAQAVKKLEAALLALIEGRVKGRRGLFERGKARALAVGAAQ